ncbi:MAG: glutaredoxin domain-containing protein [Steroidobacteraceae bacterium]
MKEPVSQRKHATLYRMVMPEHVCPFGLKARHLLYSEGFEVEDHPLRSRAETEAFKATQMVATTPQIFIDGQRIGGYDDLRRHLGHHVAERDAPSYAPVFALFVMTTLMALATSLAVLGRAFTLAALNWFVAFSMCALALLKLQDLEKFTTMFLGYDLLARRWVPYAYVYPFAEGLAGVLMLSGTLPQVAAPLALFTGAAGALSVVKVVYVDKRKIKCACVGGSSTVPLGFVSLLENLMMVAMAIWMMLRRAG